VFEIELTAAFTPNGLGGEDYCRIYRRLGRNELNGTNIAADGYTGQLLRVGWGYFARGCR